MYILQFGKQVGLHWEVGEEQDFPSHDAAWEEMNRCLNKGEMCWIIKR